MTTCASAKWGKPRRCATQSGVTRLLGRLAGLRANRLNLHHHVHACTRRGASALPQRDVTPQARFNAPSMTRPKTTWRPSSHDVLTVVMKNWLPLESGPELAMDRMPSLVCFSLKFSSERRGGEWGCSAANEGTAAVACGKRAHQQT